jgi:scyllo-inositol 2-dehydrogenase (NADP+)
MSSAVTVLASEPIPTAVIGVGLIGFGLAGASFHAPLVAAEPRMRLAAVASSRAEAVRASHPDVAVHPTPEALIADPGVDLVVIATPNRLHAPLARAALEAGRHVVVDKPLVADPADGPALVALASARGRMLSVFHNRRWDGDFLTAQRVLRSGELGAVRYAELCWDRHRPAIKPGWREEGGEGAGVLADLGPHLMDQALRLFGRPDAVAGDVVAQREGARADDWFDVTLHYGATRVRLAASTLVADPRPRFALHGDRGSFVKHGLDPQEARLRAGGSAGRSANDDPHDLRGRLTIGDAEPELVPTEPGDWTHFYAGMADAILDGAAPPVDPADAVLGLELIALARRSAAEGRLMEAPAEDPRP